MNEFELSEKERISYILQLEILSKLFPDSGTYESLLDALKYGFKLHYKDLKDAFLYGELSVEHCKWVLDILEMYRGIIYSGKDNMDNSKLRFPGFDCNDSLEVKMYSYTRYFLEVLDRYAEIKELSNGDYNSHMVMSPKYERMLSIWNKLNHSERYSMSQKQIEDVLNA